jgi:hypothetical protein
MSATMQAIINGVRADAPAVSTTPTGLWGNTCCGCFLLEFRPRDRRSALAVRQDV